MPVCPSVPQSVGKNSAPDRRIFVEFYIGELCGSLYRKSVFVYSRTKMKVTSRVDRRAFWQYLADFFIEYENFQMNVSKKKKSHLCWGVVCR